MGWGVFVRLGFGWLVWVEGRGRTVDADGGFAFACLPVGSFLHCGLDGGRRRARGGRGESAVGEEGEGENGLSEHGCGVDLDDLEFSVVDVVMKWSYNRVVICCCSVCVRLLSCDSDIIEGRFLRSLYTAFAVNRSRPAGASTRMPYLQLMVSAHLADTSQVQTWIDAASWNASKAYDAAQ